MEFEYLKIIKKEALKSKTSFLAQKERFESFALAAYFISLLLCFANRRKWISLEFESLNMIKQLTKQKEALKSKTSFFGAEGEIRTLASVSRPTPLAGAPRHQLEYFCV